MIVEYQYTTILIVLILLLIPWLLKNRFRFLLYAVYAFMLPQVMFVIIGIDQGEPIAMNLKLSDYTSGIMFELFWGHYVVSAVLAVVALFVGFRAKRTLYCPACQHIATQRGTVCSECNGKMKVYKG